MILFKNRSFIISMFIVFFTYIIFAQTEKEDMATQPEEEKAAAQPEEENTAVQPEEEKPAVQPEEEKAATLPEKENIAVLQLSGTISKEDLLTLTDKLINEIIETAEFEVFERSRMNEILMEQKFQQSDCSSSECAIEVGQLLGVRKIVFGNIGKIGDVFSISIRLINVATGKIIETASVDLEGSIEDVLQTGMKQAVYKLVGLEYKEVKKKPVESAETAQVLNTKVKRKRIFGIIAASTAVISGAAAAYFWNDKESIHNDKYLKTTVQAEMDRYIEEEEDANVLFWICTGVSSVTLPTSIILFVVKPNKKKKAEVSINTRITPVKASVSLVYAF